MKHYTTPEQTAKLIELGFEKSKSILLFVQSFDCDNNYCWGGEVKQNSNYSIGELMEMLPQTINVFYDLSIMRSHKGWWVLYGLIGDGDMWSIEHEVYRNELIDALYAMIVELKEEGVI